MTGPLEQQSLNDLRLVIELKLRVSALAPGYFRATRNRGRAMLS
jgi:hypothetical protein